MEKMKFKIGDRVIITKNTHKDLIEPDGHTYNYFDKYVGKTTAITGYNIQNEDGIHCWWTDLDYGYGKLSACETDMELV